MRTACLLAVILLATSSARGQAPVYQRMRSGAGHPDARSGYHHGRPGGFDPYGYGAFYGGYFAPPIVVGSYYQRPYPYHFDYYRYRWGGAPSHDDGDPGGEMIRAADCPCLNSPPVEAVE